MAPSSPATPVSAIVLNYNRLSELRITLTDLSAQDYPALEVVVVDNASTDGSADMVRKEFPNVKLLVMPENIGIQARRHAIDICSGTYLMLYDDDCSPSTKSDVSRIAGFLDRRPEVSVLLTSVYRTRSDYYETWGLERFAVAGNAQDGYEGLYLFGAGTAYRKEHFLKTSAFSGEIFWGDEEFDAALSFIANGYRLFYWPQVVTNHRASFVNRDVRKYYRRVTRNHLLTFCRYFDTPQVIEYSLKEFFYMSILARLAFPYVFLGVLDAFKGMGKARSQRRVIDKKFDLYIRNTVRGHRYPGPVKWLREQIALKKNRKVKVF